MKSKQEKLSNAQVEAEKLVLMDRVKTLQNSVHALTNLLSKTHKKCYEAMRVSEKIFVVFMLHDELHHRLYVLEQNKTVFLE